MKRRIAVSVSLVASALVMVPVSPASASPYASAPVTADPAGSGDGTVSGRGWSIREDSGSTTLVWRPSEPLAMTDSRPVFAVRGVVVGAPRGSAAGTRYSLRVPGLHDVTLSDVSVLASGVRLDAPAAAPSRTVGALPQQPSAVLANDPGVAGPYGTRSFSYRLKGLHIDPFPAAVEVLGDVVAPVGAPGRRPLVLFLHGRHSTCYSSQDVTGDWPCPPGWKPIASQKGYRYLQHMLASQGYVTVSIAANGINGQDYAVDDGGAAARSQLVRHHLALFAAWAQGKGDVVGRSLSGRVDMAKVLLVGHSRGGEGANRAVLDSARTDPWRVAGQVLIAPTAFGRQIAPGIPTSVLLPYCDGDVSDLEGQVFIDAARDLAAGDNALKSAVLVMGANHNFFNTEWTPGVSTAPSFDDWGNPADPVCGTKAAQRLTGGGQRAVARAYIGAAARTYLTSKTTAVALLDGRAIRAKSAGKAVVLTHALGGRRAVLWEPVAGGAVSSGSGVSGALCRGFFDSAPGPLCSFNANEGNAPHWLSYGSLGPLPSPLALRALWSTAGGRAMVSTGGRNVSGYPFLDLRVVVDPSRGATTFDVLLRDSSGRTARLRPQLRPGGLPGAFGSAKFWAQQVRVALPKTGLDLRHITSIGILATSKSGRMYLLDAFAASTGERPMTVRPYDFPRLDAPVTSIDEGPAQPGGLRTIEVQVRSTGNSTRPAKVLISTLDTSGYGGNGTGQVFTLAPGQTSVDVPLTILADGVWSSLPVRYAVTVVALRNAVTGTYFGTVEINSSTPPPTLSALDPSVTVQVGETIRWTMRLSSPMRDYYSLNGMFVAPGGATPELETGSVLRSWLRVHQDIGSPDTSRPLSETPTYVWSAFDPLGTTLTLELPIAAGADVGTGRVVRLQLQADGLLLDDPLDLTATVLP